MSADPTILLVYNRRGMQVKTMKSFRNLQSLKDYVDEYNKPHPSFAASPMPLGKHHAKGGRYSLLDGGVLTLWHAYHLGDGNRGTETRALSKAEMKEVGLRQ